MEIAAVIVATVCATALLMTLIFGGLYITELKDKTVSTTESGPTEPPEETAFDVSNSLGGYLDL